ncbi:hypothetical protein [Kangiella aquimarina]|uniref:Uncharacterized protein n=1 Tax=Kangiella aquimarina TaxID=261965 RepID=A0ABZ0X6L4_9GAMM|nr:hypothetical protein [Kangiella aquimarina]WQG85998.1 hypothetical protein SR900_03700 [Kangiella aquimarina]
MFACAKKPSMSCSAFFVLSLVSAIGLLCAGKAGAAQQETARCESSRLSIQLRRGDLAGTGNNSASQSIGINTTKTGQVTIGTPIDLNIAADVGSNFNGIVTTDTSDWVWRATATNGGGFKGFLTAQFVFSGLAIGDNKICSGPNSCLTVTNVESIVTNLEYKQGSGKLLSAEGRVRLTVDVSQANESGNYRSNLSVSIYDNWNGNQALIDCI